jgi:hypothetical protein
MVDEFDHGNLFCYRSFMMFKNIWKFRVNVILMFLSMLATTSIATQGNAQTSSAQITPKEGISNPKIVHHNRLRNTNTNTQEIKDRARNHINTNPPLMCSIPPIRDVLGWKCPKERQVLSNGR